MVDVHNNLTQIHNGNVREILAHTQINSSAFPASDAELYQPGILSNGW